MQGKISKELSDFIAEGLYLLRKEYYIPKNMFDKIYQVIQEAVERYELQGVKDYLGEDDYRYDHKGGLYKYAIALKQLGLTPQPDVIKEVK